MKAIECENLTKQYGKARGVTDLTFSVEEGDFFGFIGPNGAGKSTTIRSMLGFLRPTSGTCRILGADCWTESRKIREMVGYLPSESSFYPGMRVRDVLKLSADLRRADCRHEASRLCERLRLDTGKKTAELSFGNRKKLAVICALQHKPRLLILDEPTGGLDPLMQKEFFDILQERHNEGCSIFFSSHILAEVQNNCDRIAVIRDGRLAACDDAENLIPHNIKIIRVVCQADLSGIPGVRNMVREQEVCTFLYQGEADVLLRRLSGEHIQDIQIREPDLEEVFMHYYEEASYDSVQA